MITAKVRITNPVAQNARRKMQGPQWEAFLRRQGANVVAQARRNIMTRGGPGGRWPRASAEYAKRKNAGNTPGHGAHRADELLQDTGQLSESLTAEVKPAGGGAWSISLTAGGDHGGLSNARLLEIHAFGEGRMPARNPGESMEQFEKRFAAELAKYLDSIAAASSA